MKTPFTDDFLNTTAKKIFSPLFHMDSVTCFFIAGGGKKTLMKFFLSNQAAIKKIMKNVYKKCLFVYINTDDISEISVTAYLDLMREKLASIIKRKRILLPMSLGHQPLEDLKVNLKLLTDNGYYIIFILNDFEFTLQLSLSIYLNLESIMSINKSQITYLFLSAKNLLDSEILNKLSNLKYAVTQHINYYPLLNYENSKYIIQQTAMQLGVKLADKYTKLLYKICGGHPQLLKYATYIIHDNIDRYRNSEEKLKDLLIFHGQLQIICDDIWNNLLAKEQKILFNVVKTGYMLDSKSENSKYLKELGIVEHETNKKHRVFSDIFHQYVKTKIPLEKLVYDTSTDQIYYGLNPCSKEFTLQEYRLLIHFIKHEGSVVSRDDLAKILWGEDSYDKYSNYAIDKNLSIIRKKLNQIGYPSGNLKTLKKRGYCLIQ